MAIGSAPILSSVLLPCHYRPGRLSCPQMSFPRRRESRRRPGEAGKTGPILPDAGRVGFLYTSVFCASICITFLFANFAAWRGHFPAFTCQNPLQKQQWAGQSGNIIIITYYRSGTCFALKIHCFWSLQPQKSDWPGREPFLMIPAKGKAEIKKQEVAYARWWWR